MNILGVSAGYHDAAVSLVNSSGDILFAGHSERYSKIKHDPNFCFPLLEELCNHHIDLVAYYERPWLKQLRRLYSGEGVQWNQLTAKQILKKQFGSWMQRWPKIQTFPHHLSHAAAGFQTSTFDRATVVVIDAIGEWETTSIWAAEYQGRRAVYRKLWSRSYPHSIGLMYSAFTQRLKLKPNEEEYIAMGMAAYGDAGFADLIANDLISDSHLIKFKKNLHIGIEDSYLHYVGDADIAAAMQALAERLVYHVMKRAQSYGWSNNLVYSGGVSLNCVANRNLGEYFDNIWIMPNPGDAGSSLGAAALALGKPINWHSASLGHDITGPYPVNSLVTALLDGKIVGVASGCAEFGPRALGNRSLLADPRGHDIKDRVNNIKRRHKFRPFAPVILEEQVDEYFEMPRGWKNSRYMQTVARCRHPDRFPAIIHFDGTSRVQTVPNDGSGIRELLEKWFVLTGCPMLLNTSLNIRGEPMVNDLHDASRFEQAYGIRVYS
jgi:carbamoyltransferase